MVQENKENLEKQILQLTKELEINSKDDKATAQILLKRAQVYEFLDQINNAIQDAQTALKRDSHVHVEAKELLSRFSTHRPPQPESATKDQEKDPRDASFQQHLANLDNSKDIASIRQFVSSNDFVLVLTACGTPNTPPRIKSLSFMILTRLFNPQDEPKSYPMTYIIEQCAACFSHCMDQGKNETKLLAYRTLTAIFQTNMTVGSAILCQEGTIEEMMDVVEFETVPVQLAIAEVLTIASSDKSCRKQILRYATEWLAKMAGQSKTDPQLKAAAGTALTKLRAQSDLPTDDDPTTTAAAASSSSSPSSSSNVTEATPTLEDTMRKMNLTNDTLINSLKDVIKSKPSDATLILNAVEGLAYACLKADVKESLGNDEEFLKCLSTLTISTACQDTASSNPLLFGVGTILANLTMYRPVMDDQQRQMKKLRDLANAKQRQAAGASAKDEDKEDAREDDKAVDERIKKAIQQGAPMALMVLSKNSSVNIRTIATQAYFNLVTPQATRGQLLQQGVVKGLLPLSRDTNNGIVASQALAKLAITTDPRNAFVGDTMLDLVRPFLALCKDNSQLRQFEGLMALTNLASVDDRVRQLIENEEGMTIFENLQLSNNAMVLRAATEMVCNMTFCDSVFERYSDPSKSQNRIRLLMIFSDHDDPAVRRAASGALAILANHPGACEMMLKVDKCYERMARWLSLEETADVQHRGIEVMRCLIRHQGKSVVDAFVKVEAHIMLKEVVEQCQVQEVRSAAIDVLKMFAQFKA